MESKKLVIEEKNMNGTNYETRYVEHYSVKDDIRKALKENPAMTNAEYLSLIEEASNNV